MNFATAWEFMSDTYHTPALRGAHFFTVVVATLNTYSRVAEHDSTGYGEIAGTPGNDDMAHEWLGEMGVIGEERCGSGRTVEMLKLSTSTMRGLAGGTAAGTTPAHLVSYFSQLFRAGDEHAMTQPFQPKNRASPGSSAGGDDGETLQLPEEEIMQRVQTYYDVSPRGIPKATVSRLVKELAGVGLLERSGTKVGLGLRLFELGECASRRRSVREVALPFMADLREATGQTIHLAILDGADVVYVEILRGRNAPQFPSAVGRRLPAHATGVGKALLAAAPGQVTEAVITAGLKRVGPRTITAPGTLMRQLKLISSSGVAYEHEESAPGVACVASAIQIHDGPPVAAVSASGWIGKVDIRRVGPAVHTTALTIARVLAAGAEPS